MGTLTSQQTAFLSNAQTLIDETQSYIEGQTNSQWATVLDLIQKGAYLKSTFSDADPNCDVSTETNALITMLLVVVGGLSLLSTETANIVNIALNDPGLATPGNSQSLLLSSQVLSCVLPVLQNLANQNEEVDRSLNIKTSNLQSAYGADPNCDLSIDSEALQLTAETIQSQMQGQSFVPTMEGIVGTLAGTD